MNFQFRVETAWQGCASALASVGSTKTCLNIGEADEAQELLEVRALLFFAFTLATDAILTRVVPKDWRVIRAIGAMIFFAIYTALVVALVGSALHPILKEKDLPYESWIEILLCCWWGSAARALIFFLAVPTVFYRTASATKIISDIIAYLPIYSPLS